MRVRLRKTMGPVSIGLGELGKKFHTISIPFKVEICAEFQKNVKLMPVYVNYIQASL